MKRYGKHPYQLSNFLHSLLVAQKKKQPQLYYYRFTKVMLKHAQFLYKHGYIYGYIISRDYPRPYINTLILNLKYLQYQIPLVRKIRFYSSPSRFWWVKLRDVRKLTGSTGIGTYVISTSAGLHTELECFHKGLSGMLLYKIN